MTSKPRNPYSRPPSKVAVFAHIAQSDQGNAFVPAGLLENANSDAPSFTYGKRYVQRQHAIEIDPAALPLTAENGGIQRFTLPGLHEFGGLRDAAPDAWGRRVIENKLKVGSGVLPEVAYLLEAGVDRVGALDIRLTLDSPAKKSAVGEVSLERLLEAADRIENDEDIGEDLADCFEGLGSAGGARPKASIRDESDVLWLAKFPSKSDRACNAVLEAGTLELARAADLCVPPVHIQSVGTARVLFIRRFDRYWAAPGEAPAPGQDSWSPATPEHNASTVEGRIGFCSAMTLMGIDEYEARSSSYQALALKLRERCLPTFIDRDLRELFKRQALNIFANNNDDHLRNHAFIYDVVGKGWRLSPLYDVLPMNTVASERYLHLELGEQGRLATLDNLMTRWAAYFSSRQEAIRALHEVWIVVRAWKPYFEQFDASAQDMDYLEGAFRPLERLASSSLAKELRAFGN
ncbi:type II toxin-antitoxin system HipA family toxin [Alcaligenes faecalis subsp. faecalis]|uniref:type II toxin-antitoxin system HipA family toxin n=1 Tax=Alcaligenes faecalis TaxID=511 RepID=UPI001F1611EA|nr:HipA domain-containing protein [Alcaligenes faecalis]MBW4787046.1 type II toxin-antitoxin system HipA family toxin [Alcaligenes faecalis subsp. faecalis]